jgi:hypothetical protein
MSTGWSQPVTTTVYIQRQLINLGGPSTSLQQPVSSQHFPAVTSTRIVVVDAQYGPAKFMKLLDNALYKVKHHLYTLLNLV